MVLFGTMCMVTTEDERHVKKNNMRKIILLLKNIQIAVNFDGKLWKCNLINLLVKDGCQFLIYSIYLLKSI